MTWLAPRLSERIEIRMATQTPNDAGGMTRGYTILTTIWAGLEPIALTTAQAAYIRGEQISDIETHEFIVRRDAVSSLGRGFGKAFGDGFDSIEDLAPLKSEWFIFLKKGTTKGRIFRISRIVDNNERGEFLKIKTMEVEEIGTGYPE